MIDEHQDGFYKYSQEILEQERREEMRLRSSNSTSTSYASAVSWPYIQILFLGFMVNEVAHGTDGQISASIHRELA